MPIVAGDVHKRLSGGVANTDPNLSIGGLKSSVSIVDATLHNLFDIVSGPEGAAGSTEYRCFYIHNNHGSLTMQNATAYITTNTPSTDTSVEIGLGAAAINATETATADETTAPAGVTFSTADGSGNALSIGDIPFGQHKAVWVKRIVTAGAIAYNSDSVLITIAFDTAA
jgi:hypothetical protein